MSIHIVTDSASDIVAPADPRLSVVPLTVTFGTTSYKDGVDLSHERFFELLTTEKELPVTSQVTPFAFAEEFDRVRAADPEAQILVLPLTSKLSGTCESAYVAAEGRPYVRVVDSQHLCLSQRALVEYALRLVDEGLGFEELVAEVEAAREQVRLVALLDTLEYLRRGGRVPAVVGFVGDLVALKPVIGVRDGELVMIGKARGSKNGRNQLRQQVEAEGVDWDKPVRLAYTADGIKLLRKYIEDNADLWDGHYTRDELPIGSVGATIGTYAGPGAIAVAFFKA